MSANHSSRPIRVGLLTNEPIRLEGLDCLLRQSGQDGQPQLIPVSASAEDLLADRSLEYVVVDLNSSCSSLKTLEMIRRVRPDMRQIAIGPQIDELVLDAIAAGARAYVDSSNASELVCQAIQVVVGGSIWAPRRLLSKLIDRLLHVPDSIPPDAGPHLTDRERQVLDLILAAHSNREIGLQLGIEERTVKAHVGRLMRKTGAENRIELSLRALSRTQSYLSDGAGEVTS